MTLRDSGRLTYSESLVVSSRGQSSCHRDELMAKVLRQKSKSSPRTRSRTTSGRRPLCHRHLHHHHSRTTQKLERNTLYHNDQLSSPLPRGAASPSPSPPNTPINFPLTPPPRAPASRPPPIPLLSQRPGLPAPYSPLTTIKRMGEKVSSVMKDPCTGWPSHTALQHHMRLPRRGKDKRRKERGNKGGMDEGKE
ncbi:hypothetical protein E2C01_001115 [Portunus trituberculatus]|uniref:Uncharacterized protein n=1 Tax=Portunus trituberculatus TaxID=210409 RepID=A0A5B7CH34_PORTR|nr:hypothetical protein [Portunus trituberculatus]